MVGSKSESMGRRCVFADDGRDCGQESRISSLILHDVLASDIGKWGPYWQRLVLRLADVNDGRFL